MILLFFSYCLFLITKFIFSQPFSHFEQQVQTW
jgi:hypothetical protein